MANSRAMFTINVQDLDKVMKAIQKVSQVAKPQEITMVMREELLNIHNEYFEKRQAPDGTKWKDKSQATKDAYTREKIFNSKILEKHQYLKLLTGGSNQHASWVKSDQEYAEYIQLGTKNMVARPFIGLNSQGEDRIEKAILDMLKTALR